MTNGVDQGLSPALELGWRVAELYAQVNDFGEPSNDTLLPTSASLKPKDQLELQLRAAAGDARRAGLDTESERLERLIASAHRAPGSGSDAKRFREEVRGCHIELSKSLWARDEAAGKAYELGNGMSDTYSRVCRSYSAETGEEAPEAAWASVFEAGRIERLKRLLDDLQSRLNPHGAVVVRDQLDIWRAEAPKRIEAAGQPPQEPAVRDGLRRQTIIWRQLITGDKDPEAFLGSQARAELRGELRRLVWSRCRRWILPAAAVLFVLIAFLPEVLGWYGESDVGKGVASAAVALAGAVGITKASMAVTVRARIHQWSELLWDRAVANKVSHQTLALDSVLPPPAREERSLAALASGVGDGVRERLTPHAGAPQHRVG